MIRVYVAKDVMEAHLVRALLAGEGIEAQVLGDHLDPLRGAVPFGRSTAPSVWLPDAADVAAAERLIEGWERRRKELPLSRRVWACPGCGEGVEEQFGSCWKCGAPRGEAALAAEAPSEGAEDEDEARSPASATPEGPASDGTGRALEAPIPAVTRARGDLWAETGVVLAISVLPSLFWDLRDALWPEPPARTRFFADALTRLGTNVGEISLVLLLAARSGEGWRAFGIHRPRWLEDGGGFVIAFALTWLAARCAWAAIWGLAGPGTPPDWYLREAALHDHPSGAAGLLLLAISRLSAGFSEELVFRSFLLTRLERLLGSAWRGLLLSTLLFGATHLYQGLAGALAAGVFGLVLGAAFCLWRRLWPVALAHAWYDFLVVASIS